MNPTRGSAPRLSFLDFPGPITVTSTTYRLWACTRLGEVFAWPEQWADPGQYGFRADRNMDNTLFDVCTQLEESLLEGRPAV